MPLAVVPQENSINVSLYPFRPDSITNDYFELADADE
jgi:hypothetical protein